MANTAREPEVSMISGAHVVLYTKDAEADRAFFRDVLQFPFVDAGHGWLIFAMPPLEVAFHDAEKRDLKSGASESGTSESADRHELFLMCDDIAATLKDLRAKKVKVSDVSEQRWGKLASFTLPGGGKIGIYEPKHVSPWKSQGLERSGNQDSEVGTSERNGAAGADVKIPTSRKRREKWGTRFGVAYS